MRPTLRPAAPLTVGAVGEINARYMQLRCTSETLLGYSCHAIGIQVRERVIRVRKVLSPTAMLVTIQNDRDELDTDLLIDGVTTDGLVEGMEWEPSGTFEVVGTRVIDDRTVSELRAMAMPSR